MADLNKKTYQQLINLLDKEVITKRGRKNEGEWTEETIRELFKD